MQNNTVRNTWYLSVGLDQQDTDDVVISRSLDGLWLTADFVAFVSALARLHPVTPI